MVEAITATYAEHDDDWSVTVTGMGEELTERAPGIIAARDQADQLIESLKSAAGDAGEPADGETVVVHLLHGSALEFTTAYMTARLSRTTSPSVTDVSLDDADTADSDQAAEGSEPGEPDHPIPAQATAHEDTEQPQESEAQTEGDVAANETEDNAEPATSSAK